MIEALMIFLMNTVNAKSVLSRAPASGGGNICHQFKFPARPLMSQGISKNTVWRSVTTIPTGGMMRFLESRDSAGGTVMSGAACLPVENETGVLNCAADDAQGSYRLVTEEDGRLFIEFEFIHVDLGENYRPKEIRRADGRPVRVEGVIVECPKLSFEF